MTQIAPTDAEVGALLEAGAQAPSGGNAQAWRVVARKNTIDLLLDPDRCDSFMDVDRSASMLGLGSFAENVRVAASARGLEHRIEHLDFTGVDDPLVRFSFTGRGQPDPGAAALAAAIGSRATNRQPGDGATIASDIVEQVGAAARSLGAGYDLLAVSTEDGKRAAARMLGEADVVRTFNRAFHRQMLTELRWTSEEAERTADGIDIATLELPESARKGLRLMRHGWFVKLFVSRRRIRSMTETALMQSSHLGCITMPREPSARNLVVAGQAVQRAWLRATSLGLSVQPWSVIPFFVLRAELRPETLSRTEVEAVLRIGATLDALWGLDENARAVFVFRLSTAAPPTVRALRRPWTSFTRREGSDAPAPA